MNKGTNEYTAVRVDLIKIDLEGFILNTSDTTQGDIENYILQVNDDC